jgi:uncharacterized protein YuzE
MGTLKIYYDELGKILTVWLGDPSEEFITEETGEEILLMKNQAGIVIGFECLNYKSTESKALRLKNDAT